MAIEHRPPEDIILGKHDRLYFLAGPIKGARDWQKDAVAYLDLIAPRQALHIANPRRDVMAEDFNDDLYEEQTAWEDRGRLRAAQNGGLIFWLAARDYSIEYDEKRSYAQTTRFEFGEAIGLLLCESLVNISLGIEPGYRGNERYYRHQARRFSLPVHDTLTGTIDYALKVDHREDVEHGDL